MKVLRGDERIRRIVKVSLLGSVLGTLGLPPSTQAQTPPRPSPPRSESIQPALPQASSEQPPTAQTSSAPDPSAPDPSAPDDAVTSQQLTALADALRLTANQGPGFSQDIYYGAWQVKGSSIPAWSKGCLGHSITPGQFADSPDTARSVVLCVLKDKFAKELSNNQEPVAVQRVAAWWRTGDSDRYREGRYGDYAQTVAQVYDQQLATTTAVPNVTAPVNNTPYDRYMSEGYRASREGEFGQAVVYFQRALDERPEDSFATSALRDVSRKARTPDNADVSPQDQEVEISSEYWVEVAANAAGDRTLVAPSSLTSSSSGASVAYWEYRAFRGENPIFFPIDSDQPVRSALLYRVTNCEAGTTQTRVMKLYTKKREEIHQENFGSAGRLEEPQSGSSGAKAIAFACGQANGNESTDTDAFVESNN